MCDERERLIGYVYDECDASERREIDEHLAGCDVCRDEIRGLRGVREDLLAWDVPHHGSVWEPFAPAAATPWYRQVPAWAMAAAASVMFVVGGLGGAVTQSVLAARADRAATVASASPAQPQVVPVSATAPLTEADLSAAEQRILATLRAEIADSLQRASMRRGNAMQVSASAGDSAEQVRRMNAAGNVSALDPNDVMRIMTLMANEVAQLRRNGHLAPADRASALQTVNFSPNPPGR